jgi:hypothetical protein
MSAYADPPLVAAFIAAMERAVLAALAPVVGRLRTLETATAGLGGLEQTIAALAGAGPVPGPPGPQGPPGPPGAAAAGVETTCEYDGERTVTFRWGRGDAPVETRAIVLPLMLYRGVHVPGRLYERGDCVTHEGSVFHCNADTTSRPGSGAAAWTLAVKHGKDAR